MSETSKIEWHRLLEGEAITATVARTGKEPAGRLLDRVQHDGFRAVAR